MSTSSSVSFRCARHLEHHRQLYGVPALAAAVWSGSHGQIVINTSVGQRSVQDTTTPSTLDRWHLGSITKPMTATLVGRLVDQGVLSFDASLGSLAAQTQLVMHPGYLAVTIRQLLQHRGGVLEDIGQLPSWNEQLLTDPRPVTLQRRVLAQEALAIPPVAPPGRSCVYSNAGYLIVGAVLESLTGQSWEALLQREVFAPLQMSTAGFGVPSAMVAATPQPQGHSVNEGDGGRGRLVINDVDNPPVLGPAGTVHATLADVVRFAMAHLPQPCPAGYLTPATVDELHRCSIGVDESTNEAGTTDDAAVLCMGWFRVMRSWAHGSALCHTGSNGSWHASVWIAPARALIFIAATNAGGDAASDAVEAALGTLIEVVDDPCGLLSNG